MEKFNVSGYEALHEEWKAEQIKEGNWKLDAQKELMAHAQQIGVQLPEPDGGGQGKGGGRPNSNKKPPKESIKGSQDGNVRVVNKTS
jgi:hypothetical protein